jgi:hypothetical protein
LNIAEDQKHRYSSVHKREVVLMREKPSLVHDAQSDGSAISECPNCGLVNPARAQRCDCGFDFSSQTMERSYLQKKTPVDRQAAERKYARHMGIGLLLVIVGIIVTAASYSAAASNPSGGRYIIAYGAVAAGIVEFFIGLAGWVKYRS